MADFGLTITTGVKFTLDTLKSLNSFTFLYDPNFNESNITKRSGVFFPISFFYVVKCTESFASEVSSKPLLFYNSQNDVSNTEAKASMLQVVADNLIIKPKKYTLDVIVPFTNDKPICSSKVYSVNTLVNAVSMYADNHELSELGTIAVNSVTMYRQVIEGLIGENFVENAEHYISEDVFKDYITGKILHENNYNKVSLEEMFSSRSILKMKMWDGWRYKYVVMTSLDLDKEPTEDGVYRGKIVCQELPILTLRKNAGSKSALTLGKIARARLDNIEKFVNSREVLEDD